MKKLKISFLIAGAILAIVIIFYSVTRISAVNNPFSVYSLENNLIETNGNAKNRLKISSYNIAHGRGGKRDAKNRSHKIEKKLFEHLDKIAKQIKNESPDIMLLNEVDFSSAWSFNINQAEYIAQKCGYPYLLEQKNMFVSFPLYHLSMGNAILSRYPISDIKYIDFPPYSKIEDLFFGNHDAFYCELTLPTGPIGIIGIHFEYRSEEIRVKCAEALAEMSSKISIPIIVLGDFNSAPSGLNNSIVTKNGKNAMSLLFNEKGFIPYLGKEAQKSTFTFPSEKPERLIDWIIGKGISKFSNSKIIKSDLSDHLMIVTEIQLKDREHIVVSP